MNKKKLLNIIDAKKRGEEKEETLLQLLSTDLFIDLNNIKLLLHINQNTNAYTLLRRLTARRYLIKHIIQLPTGKIPIWGITQAGLQTLPISTTISPRPFEASKITFTSINHRLMIQRTRIYLQKKNWTNWKAGDSHQFKQDYKSIKCRPDAIVTSPKTVTFALEIELTLKTSLRYRTIIKSHIEAIEKKHWAHVIYVVNTNNDKAHLTRRLENIDYIPIGETRVPFSRYRNYISIFTIDEMQKLTHD
ncbi:replication-relaxation family protein [Photobacterium angustum]|uniref:MobC family replication-relaxation protein n=1 Tax=Photobacterium angustum TaxID=661 RepID=UPI003D0CA00E